MRYLFSSVAPFISIENKTSFFYKLVSHLRTVLPEDDRLGNFTFQGGLDVFAIGNVFIVLDTAAVDPFDSKISGLPIISDLNVVTVLSLEVMAGDVVSSPLLVFIRMLSTCRQSSLRLSICAIMLTIMHYNLAYFPESVN